MFMKLFNLFRKTGQKATPSRFSDFFLHAPEGKREEVLKEAARRANKEQRETFIRSRLKTKAG